jgi:DNA invertase Pin-like site-specific DNA recombinase
VHGGDNANGSEPTFGLSDGLNKPVLYLYLAARRWRMARISKSQLVKLQKKYKTDDSIGKLFGISRQAVHQLRTKYEIAPVEDKYSKRNEEIVSLYMEGMAGGRIAKRYHLSVSQVYRIINAAPPEERAERKKSARKATRKPVRR